MKVVILASQKLSLILQEAERGGGKRIGSGSWGQGSQSQPATNELSSPGQVASLPRAHFPHLSREGTKVPALQTVYDSLGSRLF